MTFRKAVQVRCGDIRRSSASPRPPCDGTLWASVWPSPSQTPGPPCPYPSNGTPPDANMKREGAPRHGPATRISTRKSPMGGILRLPIKPAMSSISNTEVFTNEPHLIIRVSNNDESNSFRTKNEFFDNIDDDFFRQFESLRPSLW